MFDFASLIDDSTKLPWLVPALPLLGALLAGLFRVTGLRKQAHWPALFAVPLACVCAITLLARLHSVEPPSPAVFRTADVTWFSAGGVTASARLTVDALTAVMLTAITFVGSFIVLFSVGYMRDHHTGEPESGYARYFAIVSLFVFAMAVLVMAENLLMLFAAWEGVGLCSYLLVGHWFYKPSAAHAARKAFLVTRLGDIGLMLGLFTLWSATDFSLNLSDIFVKAGAADQDTITTACLLLFLGCVGKSAQFPLYVWLPDAMEGPTPVSALIHAATMVTAGVYLLARIAPLLTIAPVAQVTIAAVGGMTALVAAFVALTQNDLKRVLAYSTVSQLGYMFLAIGAGVEGLIGVAVAAALFHLFTHAFFKAVLFLSAGSVMHAMGDVIDMRRFSGLRRVMPVTHVAFLCGALALAGVPPLSGFWSKEQILGTVGAAAGKGDPIVQGLFWLLLGVGVLTAAMTAFYTFRAYFKTFWGETKTPPEAGDRPHESGPLMTLPLIVLALGAVGLGLALDPLTHSFGEFVATSPSLRWAASYGRGELPHGTALLVVSVAVAVGGVALAYLLHGRPGGAAAKFSKRLKGLAGFSANQLYLDDLYYALFVKPMEGLAWLGRGLDTVIDGLGRLVAQVPALFGRMFQPIQIGLVQFYALATVALGVAVFLWFMVFGL